MSNENVLDAIGISFNAILTAAQTNETFRLISLILTILISLVVLARNIYDWYMKAKKDGKIDKDEIHELVDIVSDGVDEISDKIKSKGENENGRKNGN